MAVKITIEGEGLNFNTELSLLKAGQIISFLGNDSPAAPSISREEPSETPILLNNGDKNFSNGSISPREAVTNTNAKTNPQKITVFAEYVCAKGQKERFTLEEIKDCYKKAGFTLTNNFMRDVREAVAQNFIYESSEIKGEYILTDAAKAAINNKFSNLKKTVKKTNRNTTGTSKKTINESIKTMSLSQTLEGFPDYWKIKSKTKRILWIFVACEKNHITELSPADVEYIASTFLKDNIPTSSFSGLTETLFKNSFISKASKGKYKVQQQGMDDLASLKNE